jgi:hypothetical protein
MKMELESVKALIAQLEDMREPLLESDYASIRRAVLLVWDQNTEITKLREEVARLEKANHLLDPEKQLERITNKCRKLAAAELQIKQMKELITEWYCIVDNHGFYSKIISIPTTTEHLDAYVREAVDDALGDCIVECWTANEDGFHRTCGEIEEAIRARKEKK